MRKTVVFALSILAAVSLTFAAHYATIGGRDLVAHPGSLDTKIAVPQASMTMMTVADDEVPKIGGTPIDPEGCGSSQPLSGATTKTSICTSKSSTVTTSQSQAKPNSQAVTTTAKDKTVKSQQTTNKTTTKTLNNQPRTTQLVKTTPTVSATILATLTTKTTPVLETTAATTVLRVPCASYEEQVVELINIERSRANLPPLTVNASLGASARLRAREIVNVWSHTRPNGTRFFTAVTIAYSRVGENIAAGYSTPAQVVQGWMNSPDHRANIMNPCFTLIGVGYHYDSTQTYGTYWGQIFATP